MTQLNSNKMASRDSEDEVPETPKPSLSTDSQAFIGLKLRELYDDVVAEPVPDRLLELLGKLGENEDETQSK